MARLSVFFHTLNVEILVTLFECMEKLAVSLVFFRSFHDAAFNKLLAGAARRT
jgi:hypothetical protein